MVALLGVLAALLTPLPSLAVDYLYLQGQVPKAENAIAAYGTNLFGDTVSLFNGTLNIEHTDLSLRGNNDLPVTLARNVTPGKRERNTALNRQLGDWGWSLPRVGGTFAAATGWKSGAGASTSRCTNGQAPPPEAYGNWTNGGVMDPLGFWHGIFMEVPGHGTQEMLMRAAGYTAKPNTGGSFPYVTKQNWQIGCLPSIKNGAGEGFFAISPAGVRYDFDWMVTRSAEPVSASGGALLRADVHLYATKVTDRFGNWVTYTFDTSNPGLLQSIQSSDQRRIDVTNVGGKAQSATDGTRTVSYAYGGYGDLATVTVPDGRQWQFSLFSMAVSNLGQPSGDTSCDDGSSQMRSDVLTGWMVHPSGARIDFRSTFLPFATTGTPGWCYPVNGTDRMTYPSVSVNVALLQKTISGPGLATLTWRFDYSDRYQDSSYTDATSYRLTQVTDADSNVTRHRYGNTWHFNEGLELSVETGWNGSSALRSTFNHYRTASGQAYPYQFGYGWNEDGGDWIGPKNFPLDQVVIKQQGHSFTWKVDPNASGFDGYARPQVVSRFSTLGYSKTEVTNFADNTNLWVMGQVAQTTVNGTVESLTNFDANTALPLSTYKFGKFQWGYTYNADGTLATGTDGNGHVTTLGSWKRGLPQSIVYADGTAWSGVVADTGWLLSARNEVGAQHCYAYDAMGRLTQTTYPSSSSPYNCSTDTWYPTTSVFEPVAGVEYGIAAGHWRQTISTNNARKVTYFDALWRPLLTREFDAADEGNTRRMVLRYFDSVGHHVFESYPQRSIDSVTSTPYGVATSYDALGRKVRALADSELGWLATGYAYPDGFFTAITNPRGYTTTTGYSAYDNPDDAQAVTIAAPEDVSVSFSRDVWRKPTQITRSGGGLSVTRSYVYDGYQRLCKTIEPESGATLVDYDGADNITWRATGTTLTGLSCDRGNAPGSRVISYTFDARNRLNNTTFADGSQSISRSYTPDGLLQQIATQGGGVNPITWTYAYNPRRLLTQETYNWGDPNSNWYFQWGIDGYGHTASLTDPWGWVGYAPNALGQPTQVSGYASGVSYQPNGAVASYTLGNGVVHTTTLNTRGLPLRLAYAGIAQDSYTYDANGNITAITDEQEGVNNRSMPPVGGYDGLDRLRQVNGPWGTGSFTYDALGNLTASTVGGRSLSHIIDHATNRLTSLTGSQNIGIGYDANGNVTSRGGQGYTFDLGNRMTSAPGKATYDYDGHGRRNLAWFANGDYMHQAYTQDGKLRFGWRPSEGGTRHVYLGDKLIAELAQSGAVTYSHTDALGSPIAKTNSSGGLVSRTRYEPYGATVAGSTNPTKIGFTGHVNDPDTGLVYMQQRYYDPISGRFLSVDPVITDAKTGDHFNRYVYGNNNPYSFVDPDGREPLKSNLTLNVGLSATVFRGTGLNATGSNGQQLQGFTVGITLSVNLSNPQLALSVSGNELTGTGLFVGGSAVFGGGVNNGPMTSGTSKYDAAEGGVGIGKISAGAQVTANKDSVGGTVGTKLGAGAGAYVAQGSGNQTTVATPTLSQVTGAIANAAVKLGIIKEDSK